MDDRAPFTAETGTYIYMAPEIVRCACVRTCRRVCACACACACACGSLIYMAPEIVRCAPPGRVHSVYHDMFARARVPRVLHIVARARIKHAHGQGSTAAGCLPRARCLLPAAGACPGCAWCRIWAGQQVHLGACVCCSRLQDRPRANLDTRHAQPHTLTHSHPCTPSTPVLSPGTSPMTHRRTSGPLA